MSVIVKSGCEKSKKHTHSKCKSNPCCPPPVCCPPPRCCPPPQCRPVLECVVPCTKSTLVQCTMVQGGVCWNGVKKMTCYSLTPSCPPNNCCYYPFKPPGCC